MSTFEWICIIVAGICVLLANYLEDKHLIEQEAYREFRDNTWRMR